MSAAFRLIEQLTRQGVELSTDGRTIRYRGPETLLTPEMLERLKEHKAEIMRALQDASATTPTSSPEPPANVVYLTEYRRRKASAEVAS